jgi:hypothetical protein
MTSEVPKTYYFISDLHIGGDGALDACDFENELIAYLRRIAGGPRPAELIVLGDAFGLWELAKVNPDEKLEWVINHHPALFEQFRETGRHVSITLLPGNHDYDLACVPAYRALLAEYHIRLETETHLTRPVAAEKYGSSTGTSTMPSMPFPTLETAMVSLQGTLLPQAR